MKRILIYISLATFSFWIAAQMIRPIFPLYLSDLGASPFEIGLLVAIPNLLSIFLRVPLTSGLKKFGRYKFLGLSLLINFIALFLYGLSYSLNIIYLTRVLHTLAIASFGPIATASISLLTKRSERSAAMGSFLTLIALAVVVGPGLTTVLTFFLDYKSIFILSSLPSLFFSLIFFRMKDIDTTNEISEKKSGLLEGVVGILKNKYFMIISITLLAYSGSSGFFRSFFPLYISDFYLLGVAYVSGLFMIRGIFNFLSRPLSGYLGGRVNIGILIFVGMFLTTLSFLILSLHPPLLLVLFSMVISGIGWGIRAVSSISFISLILPSEKQDIGMALFYNMFDIGIFLGSVVGGTLYIYFPLDTLFGAYSIVLFIGSLLSIYLWRVSP